MPVMEAQKPSVRAHSAYCFPRWPSQGLCIVVCFAHVAEPASEKNIFFFHAENSRLQASKLGTAWWHGEGSRSPDGTFLKHSMLTVLSAYSTCFCRRHNMELVRLLIMTVVQSQNPIIQLTKNLVQRTVTSCSPSPVSREQEEMGLSCVKDLGYLG